MKTFLPARITRCILFISSVALSVLPGLLMGTLATSAKATGLECPDIGHTGVPDLTSNPTRAKLLIGGSGIDLANDISELISEVRLKEPGKSNADRPNGLIAAYCPLVAQAPGLTTRQRWTQMASVCSGASAATRRERSATGLDDHRRGTGATCGPSSAQKPG
jgi:hypothetical protein